MYMHIRLHQCYYSPRPPLTFFYALKKKGVAKVLELREQVQELAGVRVDLASALQQVNAGNAVNEQASATVHIHSYMCHILILLHAVYICTYTCPPHTNAASEQEHQARCEAERLLAERLLESRETALEEMRVELGELRVQLGELQAQSSASEAAAAASSERLKLSVVELEAKAASAEHALEV